MLYCRKNIYIWEIYLPLVRNEGILFSRIAITEYQKLDNLQMYCLIILEARSSNLRCWQGHALSDGSRGVLPYLFYLLVFTHNPWHSSDALFMSYSYIKPLHIIFYAMSL